MLHATSQSTDHVLEFLCDRRFHRQFTYTLDNKPHRVTYSDYGSPSSSSVVLFFGGLMGGRLSYSPLDQLATKYNIRIIHPDRPGIGGSDPVDMVDRIPSFIAMIPELLRHLGVEHVSLAAHSFGTIYLLNTILMYPHLLHPERPHVAFFAPWVHPDHTGVLHLAAAELLPAGMIGKFSSLAKFVNANVLPLVGASSGVSSVVASSIKTSLPRSVVPEAPVPLDSRAGGERQDRGGLDLNDREVVKELRDLIPTFLFAENVDGAGQDAQLVLRKPRSIPWCTSSRPWEDVDDAVRQLELFIGNDEHGREANRVWHVDAFHAESDSMVGDKGRVWFDECWMNGINASTGQQSLKYTSRIVTGSDHDFILDPGFGGSEVWLKRISELVL